MSCLVSIVIPTRNRVRQLHRALESCVRQSHPEIEVLVVDDGSDSLDYIESLKSYFPSRVYFFALPENKGGSYARNFGIEKTVGDYVLFLDSDDELDPDAIAKHLEFRSAHGGLELAITYGRGRRVSIDESGSRKSGEIYPDRGLNQGERVGEYLFSLEGKIFTPSMMVPRVLLNRLRFNEGLRRHQDYGFVFDASRRDGVSFCYIDQVVFNWISDYADEGAKAKGINLDVSQTFLNHYLPLMTSRELRLYLRNIASSVAVAGRDPIGFYRLCSQYYTRPKAVYVTVISFVNVFARRVYVKLFKR